MCPRIAPMLTACICRNTAHPDPASTTTWTHPGLTTPAHPPDYNQQTPYATQQGPPQEQVTGQTGDRGLLSNLMGRNQYQQQGQCECTCGTRGASLAVLKAIV